MRTVDEIWADMEALMDSAKGRRLNDEEKAQYLAYEAELAAVNEDDGIRGRHKAYGTVTVPAGVPSPTPRPEDTIDTAFNHYLRTGVVNADMTGLAVENAQGTGTGEAGGYTVPEGFRKKLVDRMKAFGGLANVVEVLETSTGETLPWNTIDDTGNEGEVVEEGGSFVGGADVKFGKADIGAYQYMAGGAGGEPIRMSKRLIKDAAFDIEKVVAGKLGERCARLQARHWVRGTGVKQPQGITVGRTGIEPADDTAGYKYKDLLKIIHSVDVAYREAGNCRWAFNDKSMEYFEGIEDLNGRPILKSATEGADGSPSRLMMCGFPVTIDNAFPDIIINDNTVNWGVFGDLREGYLIRRIESMAVVVNPWMRAKHGEIEYSLIAWADGVQQNASAYVALTGEA